MMHKVLALIPQEDGRLLHILAPVIIQRGEINATTHEWAPAPGYYVVHHSFMVGMSRPEVSSYSWTATLEEAIARRNAEEATHSYLNTPYAYTYQEDRPIRWYPDFVTRVPGYFPYL